MRRILLFLLGVMTLVLAGASTLRTVRGFYQLDFALVWLEGGLRVEVVHPESSAAAAGLRTGDLVTSIDNTPVGKLEDPVFSLAGGGEHQILVLRKGAIHGPLSFHPPSPKWDKPYLARTIVGMIALICGMIAVLRIGGPQAKVFLLLSVSALLVGAIPHRTASLSLGFTFLHRAAGMAMPFMLVRFFLIFPRGRRRLFYFDLATFLAVCWAVSTPFWPDMRAWWSVAVVLIRIFFTGGLVAGIILQVRRWWKNGPGSEERRQIEWAGLGLFVGLLPYTILLLIPQWMGIGFETFSWVAILPLAAVPLGFLAALEKYRLWDLEPITRDVLSATMILTMGALVFLLTDSLLQRFAGDLGNLRNLPAFVAGVILVIFLQPLRHRVEAFLDRWLYYGRPTPQWLLTNSTRDIAQAQDPEELLGSLSRSLREGLEIEPVFSFLRADEHRIFRVGPGDCEEEISVKEFEQPFPSGLAERKMRESGIRQRVLLKRGGTVHGVLYLGGRRGIAPLGSEAHAVIEAFAAQAALGLENARRLDELKRQTEEYRILHANTRRIIESSAAAILVCDASGRILSANQHAAEIFHLEARELIGNNLEEFIVLPPSWKAQLPHHEENAEARTRRKPPAHLIMAVSVLELESGSFNGRVVVLQDVTEVRNLQDQVREQERLAALGRFAAGLAHEINTPLTGISSYAQMLGTMTPPEDSRTEIIEKLVNQSFRVARILSNLRALVRKEEGRLESVDVVETGRFAALEAARSLAADQRLKILAPSEPLFAMAQEGPLELAMANLVRNAIEASPPDTMVEVEFGRGDACIRIEVRDRGPGVPPEMREKAFRVFVTTKTEGGGTGLGLAITRDMISRMEGHVWLEDLPEGGARAIIELKDA